MASNDDIDLLVEEAVKKIRAGGGRATARSVRGELKSNMLDVCEAFKRFTDKEKAENESKIKNAISPGVGFAIIKDREANAAAEKEIHLDEVTQLEIICEVISEEFVNLQAKTGELQNQLTSERFDHAEKVKRVEGTNSHLNGILESMQGQLDAQKDELVIERKKRDDAIKKYSGLRETLLRRTCETKAAQSKAKSLRRQLDTAAAARDKASAAQNSSEMATERLQGQVNELSVRSKDLQKDLHSETQLRIDTEDRCGAATAQVAKFQAELAELKKKKPKPRLKKMV
jgi:chromosome segregation ATPase